jgi:hypothetical protein
MVAEPAWIPKLGDVVDMFKQLPIAVLPGFGGVGTSIG